MTDSLAALERAKNRSDRKEASRRGTVRKRTKESERLTAERLRREACGGASKAFLVLAAGGGMRTH